MRAIQNGGAALDCFASLAMTNDSIDLKSSCSSLCHRSPVINLFPVPFRSSDFKFGAYRVLISGRGHILSHMPSVAAGTAFQQRTLRHFGKSYRRSIRAAPHRTVLPTRDQSLYGFALLVEALKTVHIVHLYRYRPSKR